MMTLMVMVSRTTSIPMISMDLSLMPTAMESSMCSRMSTVMVITQTTTPITTARRTTSTTTMMAMAS